MYTQYVYYRQHEAKMSLRILILTIVVFNTTLDVIEPAYAENQRPHISYEKAGRDWSKIPTIIKSSFTPPPEFIGDFGTYKSLLTFQNGKHVKTAAGWQKRRREIITTWRSLIGFWPELIEKPKIHYSEQTRRDNITQHRISIEIAPDGQTVTGYLLVPDGDGPFPAVLVVYYDAETGAGLGKELRDFGYKLAKRGFVALSIGTPEFCSLKPPYKPLLNRAKKSLRFSRFRPSHMSQLITATLWLIYRMLTPNGLASSATLTAANGQCLRPVFTANSLVPCGLIPGSYSMKAGLILITGSPGISAMSRTGNDSEAFPAPQIHEQEPTKNSSSKAMTCMNYMLLWLRDHFLFQAAPKTHPNAGRPSIIQSPSISSSDMITA
jgi:hypothetical protein